VRSDGVVVVLPDRQGLAGLGERSEEGLVEQLVAQSSVEALDEGILLRLARRDVMPFDLRLLRPAQDRHAGQLGAVVGNDHRRTVARYNEGVGLSHNPQ